MRRKHSGFTLYETLIVLTLVLGLTSLVSFQGQRHRDQLAERAFWPSWQRMWTAARQQARRREEKVSVVLSQNRRLVTVFVTQTHQQVGQLRVPPSLKWLGGEKEWVIYASGSAHAKTVEWYSTVNHHWLYQTFQLEGGLFYVEDVPSRRTSRLGVT